MEPQAGELASDQPGLPELECQICCHRYDARARAPKLLGCCHRVCAACLRRMAALGEPAPRLLSCPFCRQETPVPGADVQQLRDDGQVLAALRGPLPSPEVLLCPSVLEPARSAPDCLVLTLLELPGDGPRPEGLGLRDVIRLYRPVSLDALPWDGPPPKCPGRAGPHFLLWALCLVYLSSLPFGIYLLLMERRGLGLVLAGLVPCTLLLCVLGSLCQCLCRELLRPPSP